MKINRLGLYLLLAHSIYIYLIANALELFGITASVMLKFIVNPIVDLIPILVIGQLVRWFSLEPSWVLNLIIGGIQWYLVGVLATRELASRTFKDSVNGVLVLFLIFLSLFVLDWYFLGGSESQHAYALGKTIRMAAVIGIYCMALPMWLLRKKFAAIRAVSVDR